MNHVQVAVSWRKGADTTRSLVNASGLYLERERVLHKALLMLALLYGNETMIQREKERSRISAVQMDKFRGLFSIRRMDRMPNARLREFCRGMKG